MGLIDTHDKYLNKIVEDGLVKKFGEIYLFNFISNDEKIEIIIREISYVNSFTNQPPTSIPNSILNDIQNNIKNIIGIVTTPNLMLSYINENQQILSKSFSVGSVNSISGINNVVIYGQTTLPPLVRMLSFNEMEMESYFNDHVTIIRAQHREEYIDDILKGE